MADSFQKKTFTTCARPFALVLLILLSSSSPALSGRIPQIPAGHRTQYLLLRPDGGYSSGYDTGLGQIAVADGDAVNEVRGAYAGGPLRVQYTAGVGGYVPTVEVLSPPTLAFPPPPPPPPLPPTEPPPPVPLPPTPIETADARVLVNPDGSYAFSYRTSDQSRNEAADAQNNVRGSFSFVPPDDGIRRTVNYQAGALTGFVAQGSHIPTAPPATVQPTTDETPPTMGTEESQTDEGITDESSTEKGSTGQRSGNSDASYAFGYRTPDQERIETSDRAGNVRGQFSFIAPDGVRRRVDYEAGDGKGFIAKGDHLPTPPSVQNEATLQVNPSAGVIPRTTFPLPPPPPPSIVTSWNTGSWPVTVPDPLRVDSDLGNYVVRNYLPPHPRKTGYVFDIKQ